MNPKRPTLKPLLTCWGTIVIFLSALHGGTTFAQGDSNQIQETFKEYHGILLDADDKTPVIFASIIVKDTYTGTVTNTEGSFSIKIPYHLNKSMLSISRLGYKTKNINVTDLSETELNTIFLNKAIIALEPVVVTLSDPETLLREAIKKIPANYGDTPVRMTGFYRESIRKNRNYKSVGEAVVDIYKGSYQRPFDIDRISLYKGRKNEDFRNSDTIMVKFMGGPVTASLLDLVKNPSDILAPEFLDYYDFTYGGMVYVNGRETYTILFDQKDSVQLPLYKGKIFIDQESKAFVSIDFQISPKQLDKAADYLILRKPFTMDVDVVTAHYLVNYRLGKNRWYLNYVRLEDHFSIKWKRKLFRSEYYLTSETAITAIEPWVEKKPRFRDSFKKSDFFSDKVSDFEDPEFWGPANIIEPEKSILEAIMKINKHLKRNQD